MSTEACLSRYRADASRYRDGVTAAALLVREARDNVPARPGDPRPDVLAAELIDQVRLLLRQSPGDPGPYVALSELNLLLGHADDAELWLFRFLAHDRLQPGDV